MKYAAAQNVSDQIITIDDDGRTLGGGEWGAVRYRTNRCQEHIDAGRLVVHPSLEGFSGMSPEARAAVDTAAELNSADQADDEPEPEPEPVEDNDTTEQEG